MSSDEYKVPVSLGAFESLGSLWRLILCEMEDGDGEWSLEDLCGVDQKTSALGLVMVSMKTLKEYELNK